MLFTFFQTYAFAQSNCGKCGEGVGGAYICACYIDYYYSECQIEDSISAKEWLDFELRQKFNVTLDSLAEVLSADRDIDSLTYSTYTNAHKQLGGCSSKKLKEWVSVFETEIGERFDMIDKFCSRRCITDQ